MALLWLVAAGAALAQPPSPPAQTDELPGPPEQVGTGLDYADFVAATQGFDRVVVWEGLPHPLWERQQQEKELATKPLFWIGKQAFYRRPLPFRPEALHDLSAAIRQHRDTFAAWSGLKFCGGFHADYAVEWRRGQTVLAQALICFGCREAVFRVGERAEEVDLTEKGYRRLRSLLAGHRQERPPAPPPAPATGPSREDTPTVTFPEMRLTPNTPEPSSAPAGPGAATGPAGG